MQKEKPTPGDKYLQLTKDMVALLCKGTKGDKPIDDLNLLVPKKANMGIVKKLVVSILFLLMFIPISVSHKQINDFNKLN